MTCRLVFLTFCLTLTAWAQSPEVWGKAPEASDDRFSNPKSVLYAGPNGWWNTGEVRATVANTDKTALGFIGNFQLTSGAFVAVKDLQTLHFDFGSSEWPAAGTYEVGANGNLAGKKVKIAFADVSKNQILEWASENGAGTLTVSFVNGFTYLTCRNVTLKPSGLSNKGATDHPLTLGFEGALKPN